MRKFLLWLGTMWVGMITIAVGLSMLISTGDDGTTYNGSSSGSGAGAFFGGILVWLFALAVGLGLSAPAFLNPPEDDGGIWSFRLPLPLWLFLMMMKLTSWIGFYVLLGTWILIFKVWNTQQSNRRPTFSNAPQPAGYPPQPVGHLPNPYIPQQQQRPQSVPASWQRDPTGRYAHRWWDGARWTDRVANGGVQTVDPI